MFLRVNLCTMDVGVDGNRREAMPSAATLGDREALRKQVEVRAYALWEGEGRPYGRDLDHWRRAESGILSTDDASSGAVPREPTASSAAAQESKG